MPHVVCVGDLMVDVLAQLPGPLAPGSDTPAVVTPTGGGAAANAAVWLVAAGVRATFVGCVGDDAFGRRAVEELTASGVTVAVAVDPTRPTGTCIVLVDPQGERTMIPSAGANAGLGALDAGRRLPPDADCLYLSGYALLGEGSRPFALAALELARERGWAIVVDAASAAPLRTVPEFLELVGRDVLLLANADEARVLTGLCEPAAAAQALAVRCGRAVVKRGADGAVWSDGSGVRSTHALPAAVVDSTGAGDAFAAGYLAACLAGDLVPACLTAGARFAAAAIALVGARPSGEVGLQAEAGPPDATSLTGVLVREHRELTGLLAELRPAGESLDDHRARRRLVAALLQHFAGERQRLYPAIRSRLADGDAVADAGTAADRGCEALLRSLADESLTTQERQALLDEVSAHFDGHVLRQQPQLDRLATATDRPAPTAVR